PGGSPGARIGAHHPQPPKTHLRVDISIRGATLGGPATLARASSSSRQAAGAATEPVELFYWRLLAHQSSTGAPSAPSSTTAPATGHRSAGSRSRWRPRRWRDTGRHQAASWAYSRDRRSPIAEPPMLALP